MGKYFVPQTVFLLDQVKKKLFFATYEPVLT